jgi:hypothetical protein
LIGKESSSALEEHKMDLRKGKDADRERILCKFDVDIHLEKLQSDGIRTIKQVELYSKWRKHVPDKHKSPLYDNPGDDVLLAVREDRKDKKKYIKQSRLKKAAVDSTGIMASRKSPEPKKTPAKLKTTTKSTAAATRKGPKTLQKTSREENAAQKPSKRKK